MLLKNHPIYNELVFEKQDLDLNKIKNLTLGSKKKLLWLCPARHEYSATVYHRIKGSACPYCAGFKILPGFNDLKTLEPKIASQWHSIKNKVNVSSIARSSKQKYWWICEEKHEWEATPKSRVMNKSNCPYCSKNKTLTTTFLPMLFKEYDISKNSQPLTAYSPKSNKKVWWICQNNKKHSWATKIYLRNDSNAGTKCPYCNYSNRSSSAEKELEKFFQSLQVYFLIGSRKIIPPKELDFYFPELKIAIEYNGLYWHSEEQGKDKNYHYSKYLSCLEKDIQLIQLWEDDWVLKPDLVKRYLSSVVSPELYQSEVTKSSYITDSVPLNIIEVFIQQNSFKKEINYEYSVSLLDNDQIRSLLLIEETDKNFIIKDYISNFAFKNDLEEMAKYLMKRNEHKEVIIISDNCLSNENTYIRNGFKKISTIKPSFTYLLKNKRTMNPDGSEEALNKIWDAGKTKWKFIK